jgi:hypothetical protein
MPLLWSATPLTTSLTTGLSCPSTVESTTPTLLTCTLPDREGYCWLCARRANGRYAQRVRERVPGSYTKPSGRNVVFGKQDSVSSLEVILKKRDTSCTMQNRYRYTDKIQIYRFDRRGTVRIRDSYGSETISFRLFAWRADRDQLSGISMVR